MTNDTTVTTLPIEADINPRHRAEEPLTVQRAEINSDWTDAGTQKLLQILKELEDKLRIENVQRKQLERDLHSYAHRLIVMEEELRNKIATELHDEICRDLTVLGLNLSIISASMTDSTQKKLIARIKSSEKLVKDISHTARNIMVGLRPPGLDDFGLLAALRWHAELFEKNTGIEVSVQADDSFPRLTLLMEATLFRIFQEALINTAKHASSPGVSIKLYVTEGVILLKIRDVGKGFIPSINSTFQNGTGWGIRLMRERAKLIGGEFAVDSTPGKGTTVSVVVPLRQDKCR
jgi:signal transduction histidine kinase